MAILEANIVLYKASNQTDDLSGGGRISDDIVVSNTVNNLFFPLARIDHVKGDVSLRKTHLKITSAADEVYAENHFAMKTLPSDEHVNVIVVPDDDPDSTVEDILLYIHNNSIRKFYGATTLASAMTNGDGSFTVADAKAVILPVINTEVGRTIPIDNTVLNQTGSTPSSWRMEGASVGSHETAGHTYYISLSDIVSGTGVAIPYRILIREDYQWVEYITDGTEAAGDVISPNSSNTETYSLSGEVLEFKIPDDIVPDPDTYIIVIYPRDNLPADDAFDWWQNRLYYTENKQPLKPGTFTFGTFKVWAYSIGGGDWFGSDEDVTVEDDGDGNLATDIATVTIATDSYSISVTDGHIDYATGYFWFELSRAANFSGAYIEFTQYVPINSFENWNSTAFPGDGKCPIFTPGDVAVIFDPVGGDEMLLVSAVDYVTNVVTTQTNCLYDHATVNTVPASAFVGGNLQALVTNMFTQESWDMSTWTDDTVGNEAQGDFDSDNYPIVLTNIGSAMGRWAFRVVGLSPLTVDVYHEKMGVIANNIDATADIGDPLYASDNPARLTNPVTDEPYMTIEFEACGDSGGNWQVGNVFFVKTEAAEQPCWFLRVVESGVSAIVDDNATVHIRGDVE